jgi:hypothetical protein
LGSPRRVGRRLFPCSVPESVRPIVHRTFYRPACSLHVRVASSKLLRAHPLPEPFRGGRTCQGFCPHRDITKVRPLTVRLPKPHYVPSTGDRSLSTVCSTPWLRGLFHPRATYRARPVQGVLSPRSATRLVAGGCPLAVATFNARRTLRVRRPHQTCLDLEAFLCAEARARLSGDQPDRRSLPSSGSELLQAPHPSSPETGYPGSSARDVPNTSLPLRERRRSAPAASLDRGTGQVCHQTHRPARAL